MTELDDFLNHRDERDDDLMNWEDGLSIGCCFPGQCCMVGEHFTSECHTAEMMRDYESEARPVSDNPKMPFGKHKGELLSDCPTEYLDWLIGNDWVKDYLRAAVEAELNKRPDWHAMDSD